MDAAARGLASLTLKVVLLLAYISGLENRSVARYMMDQYLDWGTFDFGAAEIRCQEVAVGSAAKASQNPERRQMGWLDLLVLQRRTTEPYP